MTDLPQLVDPAHTALVTVECQQAVLGPEAPFPALAEAAAATDLVTHVRRLCTAARSAGVPVLHCTAERRADGLGANRNARLFTAAGTAPLDSTLHPGLGADPERDLLLPRLHGPGPFHGTGLDPVLRNLGVRTVVAVGVSLNVALLELALGLVASGYSCVLPRDATAGTPAAYAEAVLRNTLALLTTLTTTSALTTLWNGAAR